MMKTQLEIIEDFKREIPVDVRGLVLALDLNFELKPLPEGVAGRLIKVKNEIGKYLVQIAIDDHPRRQRFTIAHEIAHYILHRDLADKIEDSKWYRSSLSDSYERQANLFAAEILMPQDEIEKRMDRFKTGEISYKDMAREFFVSPAAMEIRINEVGHILQEKNQAKFEF